MFINNYIVAILQFNSSNRCYLFDSHSRDQGGLPNNNGKSICLNLKVLTKLNYIQAVCLQFPDRQSAYFQLQYVGYLNYR